LKSAFQKISGVRSLTGGTNWYLSKDCLLAAKRTMYAVEYRRFYLRDLECIAVWPNRSWRFRLIIPGVLFTAFGAALWQWANSTSGEIFTGIGLAWVVLELALGPTATSRVRTTGVSVDLPVVKRTRRAHKVLQDIDAAVRASRDVAQPAVPTPDLQLPGLQPTGASVQAPPPVISTAPSIADGSVTNGI
jgi:hypothetical protein